MDNITLIGTDIATIVAAVCVWIVLIAVAHDLLHRFLSKTVANSNRRIDSVCELYADLQRQLDDLKRELEEMKQKE